MQKPSLAIMLKIYYTLLFPEILNLLAFLYFAPSHDPLFFAIFAALL